MAKVILDNIGKSFDAAPDVVKDVNLEIEDGEFLVLVGPSGCGKSTTLRMIAGLEDVTVGRIMIGERDVTNMPPKDRDIAMVFQNYALYPHMTVYENMAFGMRLRKVPRPEIDKSVREAAAILGMTEYLDRKPKALSGGQRQRVAMGRAIVRNPAVFLFDEPLSNLDAKMRVEMRKEILRLHKRIATTVIYVTHDQVEAMTLGQRIVVMKDGVIQQVAPPLEVYRKPANVFVAGFIGTPPMNLINGQLVKKSGRTFFSGSGIDFELPEGCAGVHGENREIVLGMRPEDVEWAGESDGPGIINGTAELVEYLGGETLVMMQAGGTSLQVKIESQVPVKLDQKISIQASAGSLHFFDAASGARC